MEDELATLAAAGAATLVTAMTTDLWQTVRDGFTDLFRRSGRRRREITARLDSHAALIEGAAARDAARQAVLGSWARELDALLRSEPSCREPLARLVDEVRRTLPDGHRETAHAHLEQTNTAHGSGTVFAVQGGDQPVHWPGRGDTPGPR
ncbi:hypothetical protein [Streptomyces sp. NPDC059398]|uniref:hypothetical protein n=1 Tax=Streptomyces sp. NPDC059398 TaxID=3346820 RepID=UPI0036A0C431